MLSGRGAPTTVELDSGGVLIACPVMSGAAREPWLAVLLPVRQSVEEASLSVVLDVASLAAGHRLAVARMVDEREARRRSALLGELIDTSADATPGLLRRALDAGWMLDGWHIGIKVLAVGEVDLVARRSEVADALAAEGIDANVVEQADGWAAWTTLPGEPRPEAITRIAECIRAAQARLEPTMETWVGVGRAHDGPAGIGSSLSEAGDASRLAGSRSQTGRFLHVDRLGLAQLLLAWTRTDTFQPAAAALLARYAIPMESCSRLCRRTSTKNRLWLTPQPEWGCTATPYRVGSIEFSAFSRWISQIRKRDSRSTLLAGPSRPDGDLRGFVLTSTGGSCHPRCQVTSTSVQPRLAGRQPSSAVGCSG